MYALNEKLAEIETFAKKESGRGMIARVIKHKSILSTIMEYRKSLRRWFDVFQVGSITNITENIAKTQEPVQVQADIGINTRVELDREWGKRETKQLEIEKRAAEEERLKQMDDGPRKKALEDKIAKDRRDRARQRIDENM